MNAIKRSLNGGGAEEYPKESNQMEGQDNTKYLGPGIGFLTWFEEQLMKYE